jgi:hypothetical protein
MKRKKYLIFLIAILVVFIVLIGVYIISQYIILSKTYTYTDPDDYYSIKIPLTWRVDNSTGGMGETGVGTSHPVIEKIETKSFDSPNGIFIGVQVYEGKPSCDQKSKNNTTLSGLPASYDIFDGYWFLNTENATFGINYNYPGALISNPGGSLNPPQPNLLQLVSQIVLLPINQQIVNTVVHTFHPKDLHTLKC